MTLVSLLLASSLAAAEPAPAPKPLVAVAPFSGAVGEEYQWMGVGLSELVLARLGRSPDLLVMNTRQWGAVQREHDQASVTVDSDAAALTVARSLGSKLVVRGTYAARWPDVRVHVRVLDVGTGKLVGETTLNGFLEDTLKMDEGMAKPVFDALKLAPSKAGVGTRNLYAWREAMLCRDILSWQSVSPRARVVLPLAAVADAERHCRTALALEPGSVEAREGLGLAKALQGDAPGALQELKMAQTARGGPDLADVIIAWVKFRTGSREDAVQGLQDVLAKRPGFLHARGVLGQALLELRRPADAEREFTTYLAWVPKQPWALSQLGYALARQGKFPEALARTQEAVQAAPEDVSFVIELASRHIDAKQLDKAEAVLRQALDQDPRAATAYLRLGYVYLLQDNRMLARPILEKAIVEADLEAEWRIRGVALLDLAKVEMRESHRAAALTRLTRAVNEGLAEPERLEDDPDLAPLKTDKDFQALVDKSRAQQKTLGWSTSAGEGKP